MKNPLGILIIGIALGLASNATAVPVFFDVSMDGLQEVPGPGDPDGTGTAFLSIDPDTLTIEWSVAVNNIDLPITGAHIHEAPPGVAGPIVVDFESQLSGLGLMDADLVGVVANPGDYYVNVHNQPYPDGAIRGQLPSGCPPAVIPVPSALGLAVLGLVSLRASRRKRA